MEVNGQTHRRHVDQVRRTEYTGPNPGTSIIIPEAGNVVEIQGNGRNNQETRHSTQSGETKREGETTKQPQMETPARTETPSVEPMLRRSSIIRKSPTRLDL